MNPDSGILAPLSPHLYLLELQLLAIFPKYFQSPQGTLINDGNPLVPSALPGTGPSYALATSCGVSMIGQVLGSVSLLWDTLRGHITELLSPPSQQGSRDSSFCKLPWPFLLSIRMHVHPAALSPTVQLLLPPSIILWAGFSFYSCPWGHSLQQALSGLQDT